MPQTGNFVYTPSNAPTGPGALLYLARPLMDQVTLIDFGPNGRNLVPANAATIILFGRLMRGWADQWGNMDLAFKIRLPGFQGPPGAADYCAACWEGHNYPPNPVTGYDSNGQPLNQASVGMPFYIPPIPNINGQFYFVLGGASDVPSDNAGMDVTVDFVGYTLSSATTPVFVPAGAI